MGGVGGDLFAVIYVAKERKIYVLNSSGTAPSGATLARFNFAGLSLESEKIGGRRRGCR